MTTELATYTQPSTLGEQMEFARAVVIRPEGGARSLLPESYRDNPANVLLAVGLGASMGLSPAESLYRIDVIQGKPCASAELIAANVRKAGHKLRVTIDDEAGRVTATIVRADDPDYPFTIVRDMEWAQRMGLQGKDNYKKQPLTMLQWRAISGVARLACPEALYGVQYTPDEMGDLPSTPQGGGLAEALAGTTTAAEQIPHEATPEPDEDPSTIGITDRTRGEMFALFTERKITDRDRQIEGIVEVIGHPIESRRELTEAEGLQVVASLRGRA